VLEIGDPVWWPSALTRLAGRRGPIRDHYRRATSSSASLAATKPKTK
jgi:hypothetical protein